MGRFRPSRGPRLSTRYSRTSSSVNRVHDRNTGNGGGRTPSGSFSRNDILALSKTSLMEMDTPPVDTQPSHLVGNVCIDHRSRLIEIDSDLGAAALLFNAVAVRDYLPLVHGSSVFGILGPDADWSEEIKDDALPRARVFGRLELAE